MILSPRSPLLPALAALLAAGCAAPFTMAPFSLSYCEGDEPRPIHCDCTRARREVAGGRVGRLEVSEYDRAGALRRRYDAGRELRFVLIDRWLVIGVQSRSTRPSSLLAWLDCGDTSIAGTIVPRAIDRDSSGLHEHEFLALFAGPHVAATCDLHVVFADGGGWTVHEMTERVYAVARVRPGDPLAGLTWDVTLPDDPALTPIGVDAPLDPPLEPAEPRLCQ